MTVGKTLIDRTETNFIPQENDKEASLFMCLIRKLYCREDLSKLMQDALTYLHKFWKQVGVSFRQYFKALLKAVKAGRTDYENLLPMTICLN
mgnify:CR=1 FL=1